MNANQRSQKPVLFVTGGSRGIGKAIIEKFQSHGWVVAACSTSAQGVQAGGSDLGLVCDVGNSVQVGQTIQSVIRTFGRLDAVINNAGVAGGYSLNPDDDSEWHRVININLNGTYYVSKHALPYLPDYSGRIVNISSVLGLKGVPDAAAYCAAKHGVVGFTRALAHDAAKRHITVNAICPGWVRTDMALTRMQEIGISESNLQKSVPLGRFIEPQEVADLAYFLVASEAAAGLTGQAIALDGGFLA
jgi:3-oxoacyl-[acyl-carrier protein] reductase